MSAERLPAQVDAALALLHGHLKLAQALVDVLAASGAPPERLAWATAKLDQLQAAGRDLSVQVRPDKAV